jgi:uncharacterized phiE125 gp8 family phage protein|tara:strand:+ start:76 stop:714 length:639 start_codon:yes stop_codon:yes gene_type:complete
MIRPITTTGAKFNNVGRLRYKSTNIVTENVTLAEAKAHLRIDSSYTADDTYITTLISVARSACENYVGFLLAKNSGIVYYFDKFPDSSVIFLDGIWMPDSLTIQYYDVNDSLVTWDASNYAVDEYSRPTRIVLNDSSNYPDTSDNIPSGVRINLINAGPDDADLIPKAIHQGILLVIGRYYEIRQDVVTGTQATEIPKMVEHLLNPYRIVEC